MTSHEQVDEPYREQDVGVREDSHRTWNLSVLETGIEEIAHQGGGRRCIGASLAFEPDNVDDAYRVVRETLTDRDGIERWRGEVRERFRPVPWSATADALLEACAEARLDTDG